MSKAEPSTPPLAPSRSRVVDLLEDDHTTVPDHLVRAVLIRDPAWIRKVIRSRERSPSSSLDEVWDGVYVMSPAPNYEHQIFVGELILVFGAIRQLVGGADVLPGLNVSDRVHSWQKNYRVPDVAVYFKTNPAIACKTHRCGGPDFAVEILSDNDQAREKLDFYAKVNTRELLILDRDDWAMELYRLVDGRLVLVGTSTLKKPDLLASEVLPLTFQLVPGQDRPILEVTQRDGGTTWRI